jgi:hypothetical protein
MEAYKDLLKNSKMSSEDDAFKEAFNNIKETW